ncbi:MAG: hypothetical protein HYZ75_19765 [Elusimicrobia bacterium]|nr:hypothetical protein [Elusimicrobiota bacterium]
MKEQRRRRRFETEPKAVPEPPRSLSTLPPEIPTLKEKEEEKKGAGVPWYAGSSGSAPGIIGGQGVARLGASASLRGGFLGRISAGLSNALGGPSTFLGGMFAGAVGKWLVLGGMLAWGGLMLAAGGRLMGGWGARGLDTVGFPSMSGAGASGIVIDAPKDRSLGYLTSANNGEILWDANKPKETEPVKDAAGAEAGTPVEAPKPEIPSFEMPDVAEMVKGGLNRDGFIKKLTGDVGQLHGGAPKIKDASGFALKKTFSPKGTPAGRIGSLTRAKRQLAASRLNMRGRSSRASGQLKLAKALSKSGSTAGSLGDARTFAADAFDQGKTIGGELAAGIGDGIVAPSGSGAPDVGVPDLPPGTNITPYQSQIDNAKAMDNNSAMLKVLGMMMIAIGVGLVAVGRALMGNHTTFPIGIALVAAGMSLIALGTMMLAMSASQAKSAQNQGKNIDEQYGQEDQGAIVDDCANQAQNGGTKADNCNSTPPQVNGRNTVREDVQTELDSDYTLEGGMNAAGEMIKGAAQKAGPVINREAQRGQDIRQ